MVYGMVESKINLPETEAEAIIERLKKAAGANSDTQLAEILDITRQNIGSARKRNEVPPAWLIKIGEITGTSIDWLLRGRHVSIDKSSDSTARNALNGENMDSFELVPVAKAHLNAGGGSVVLSEGVRDYYAFKRAWLRKVTADPHKAILMSVMGDSMEPLIYDGDTVMIDMGRQRLYSGHIYAIGVQDTIMIKRLELLTDNCVRVISDNKATYSPYEINMPELRILGQVIWYARQLVRPE